MKRGGRRGQVLPLVALLLSVLLGAAALAVDVGYLRYQQRIAQTAADSAAMAGATELSYADSAAAAQSDSASNGFANNGGSVVVTVNNPPASGPNSGKANAVEVIVTAKYATFFENVFQMALATVSARAVVVNVNQTDLCFYLLGTSTSNISSDTLTSKTCGLLTNGSLNINVSTLNMLQIGYAGSSANNNFSQATFSNAQPAAAVAVADPCPTIAGCQYLTANPPAQTPCTYNNFNPSNNSTMYPGVYCGPINASNLNLTFSPGLYVFTSGVNLSGGTITGTGVTWYNPIGSLNIQNTAQVNLSAPTTGPTAGVLIYQPASNSNTLNWSGFLGTGAPGVLYAPTANLTSNGINFSAVSIIVGSANISTSTFTFPAGDAVPGQTQSVLSE